MKKTLTARIGFFLLLALSPAARTEAVQNRTAEPPPLKQLTLTLELQDLPGRDAEGSFWEVYYQWRIADQREFDRWAEDGEDPAGQKNLGILLSRQSFTRRNLSARESRHFTTSIPVSGELLERLRRAGRQPQIVWLDATVRIHDGRLGTDVVKKVNPVWGPYFYRHGVANLRMELTPAGYLRWYTGDAPPWDGGRRGGLSARTSPE